MTQSRNQREGGYLGKFKSVWELAEAPRRHHRQGDNPWTLPLNKRALFTISFKQRGQCPNIGPWEKITRLVHS